MGREVRRIDLRWDWFERKGKDTWAGYLLPSQICPLCEGSGKALNGKECIQCYGEGKDKPNIEPIKGEGYQIWQDVSKGGPVSPVFENPEDLAEWMVKNDNSITKGTSYSGWLKFIKAEGSAPSGIMSNDGFKSGVESLYDNQ